MHVTMRLSDEYFPLLLGVAPRCFDQAAVEQLAHAFEPYFRRRQRYALVSLQPTAAEIPSPRDRQLVLQWLGSDRVVRHTRELCVGASAIIENALWRGAFTAVLWVWKPPCPVIACPTPAAALEQSLDQLTRAGVPLPKPKKELLVAAQSELAMLRRFAGA